MGGADFLSARFRESSSTMVPMIAELAFASSQGLLAHFGRLDNQSTLRHLKLVMCCGHDLREAIKEQRQCSLTMMNDLKKLWVRERICANQVSVQLNEAGWSSELYECKSVTRVLSLASNALRDTSSSILRRTWSKLSQRKTEHGFTNRAYGGKRQVPRWRRLLVVDWLIDHDLWRNRVLNKTCGHQE